MLSRCSFPKCTTFTIGGLFVYNDTAPRAFYTRGRPFPPVFQPVLLLRPQLAPIPVRAAQPLRPR